MSIKLRASLDYLLDDKDLHFGMTDEKKLAIKTKCGQTLVVFNDLVFAKKEPTRDEISFIKDTIRKQIEEINKKLNRLKELEQNEPEKISVFKKWGKDNVYEVIADNLKFNVNIKTKEVSNIRIDADNVREVEKKLKQIHPLMQKAEERIKWQEERDNIIKELNQNCNI